MKEIAAVMAFPHILKNGAQTSSHEALFSIENLDSTLALVNKIVALDIR